MFRLPSYRLILVRHSRIVTLLLLLISCWLTAAAVNAQIVVLDNGTSLAQQVSAGLTERNINHTLASVAQAESIAAPQNPRPLWIAPHFGTSLADEASTIVRHLERGGGLLALGESPFQKLLYPWANQLVSESAYQDAVMDTSPVVNLAITPASAFNLSTDAVEIPSTLAIANGTLPKAGGPQSVSVAEVNIPELRGWTTFNTQVSGSKPANAITTFWARGTSVTTRLALEWMEEDYSRWIATIRLTSEWKFYALPVSEFKYFHNPAVTGRGGAGDYLHTEKAAVFSAGLAQTHTPMGAGPHNFAFSSVGMFSGTAPNIVVLPNVDSLYPNLQTYPIRPVTATLSPTFAQTSRGTDVGNLLLPATAWSSYWRPMGSGYGMLRRLRTVPVVIAYNADGTRAGCLASITVSHATQFQDAIYGYISLDDDALLTSPPWMDLIGEMAERMQQRAFLREGGSTRFTYDVRDLPGNQFSIGARTARLNLNIDPTSFPELRIVVRRGSNVISENRWSVSPTAVTNRSASTLMNGSANDLLTITTELIVNGRTLDQITHEVGFDGPRTGQQFVCAQDGQFFRNGAPWRAFGINYMPSSGLASTNANDFEHFTDSRAYDPEIVAHDLERIAALGYNAISVFVYRDSVPTSHMLDLLRRARAHGFLVNMGLRPAYDPPLAPPNSVFSGIITPLRLAEKDEIFAYDIAWEPWWGSFTARQDFGSQWQSWLTNRYGSLPGAYGAWGYTPPDVAKFPTDDQLRIDGPWRTAVADYRRFVDETLSSSYTAARNFIRQLDPHHLVSFRQSEGANPFVDPAGYPMELRSTSDALDFLSPEAYGIGDSDSKAKTMSFAAAYAQGLAPGKPLMWPEYGQSVWSGDPFKRSDDLLARQATVHRNVLHHAQQSRAAGTFAWWFAGGYRAGEESDYGILNPDGTERPVVQVIREFASIAKASPAPVIWGPELVFNRSSTVRGYAGIYEALSAQFNTLITSNSIPVIHSTGSVRTPAYHGNSAARLTNTTPGAWTGDTALDLGSELLPVEAGHRLRVSFAMRNGNADPSLLFRFTMAAFTGRDPQGWPTGWLGDTHLLLNHAVPLAWTPYSFVYTVPANGTYLTPSFRMASNGNSVIVDDIRIQDLDNGSIDLLPNRSLEDWTTPPDERPMHWRFFAVSGASGTLERIGSTTTGIADWHLH